PAVARHTIDFEINGVQNEPAYVFVERSNRGRANAVEPIFVQIRLEIQIDLFHDDDLVGSVVRSRAGKRKRAVVVGVVAWSHERGSFRSSACVNPPVTSRTAPVTKSRSVAMKNRTASATSS